MAEPSLSESQTRRRTAIIAAALEVFDRDGFDAARMADVAAAAGVAKGTLYLYFETKEDLLEGMVTAIILPVVKALKDAGEDRRYASEKEKLHAQMRIVSSQISQGPMRKIMRLMIADGPKRKRLRQFYFDNVVGPNIKSLEATIDSGIRSGEFSEKARSLTGLLLAAPFVMSAIWKILFQDHVPIDEDKLFADMWDVVEGTLMRDDTSA